MAADISLRLAWQYDRAAAAEAEVARLQEVLADRDREIAELKADEPTLDDDQPGAPQ
ncbi:hypothetical protein ACWGIU_14060 [Streptomyces sp. NPDC054840]